MLTCTHRSHYPVLVMILAIIAVIILLLKVLEIGPVANWSWMYVLAPFVVLWVWWEFVSKWLGWDKKKAAEQMRKAEEEAKATKKKARGF